MGCLHGQPTPSNAHMAVHAGDKKKKYRSAGFLLGKPAIKASCKEQNLVKVEKVGEEAQARCRWQPCVGSE